jgi:hypothetical protein
MKAERSDKEFSVTMRHGKLVESDLAPYAIATVHPSSILRAPDAKSRRRQMREFVDDLKQVATLAKTGINKNECRPLFSKIRQPQNYRRHRS